jgi:outer membrane immunogenic protein
MNTTERIDLYGGRCGQIATFAGVLNATFVSKISGARVPMKRLGIVSVAVASLATAAAAADLAVKAPPSPPMFLPFTWTGAYAGANGGYGWTTSGGLDATGGFGGGQIGYNIQTGGLVLGVEGDIAGGDISQTVNGNTVAGIPFTTAFTNDALASLRGRAGLAYNTWLFYGTVGGGWAHDKISVSGNIAGAPFSSNAWLSGWTAGAGVEWSFAPNWSTKFEYLHYGLGTPNSLGTVPAGKVDIDTLKIGINYLFR